jgi:PAS domain S-box-containing protein
VHAENDPARHTEFRGLFQAIPGAACVFDADLRMAGANPAWERAFTRGQAAPLDVPMSEIVHPDDLPSLEAAVRGGAGQGTVELPIRIKAAGGEYRARGGLVIAIDDGLTCLLLHEQGVDSAAWRSLIEQRELFALTEKVARTGIGRIDAITRRVTGSPGMYALFGLDPATFSGDLESVLAGTIHPDDRSLMRDAASGALATEGVHEVEFRTVKPDGTIAWLHLEAMQERDAVGHVTLVTVARDITEHKAAEDALRHSEEKFSAAFHVSPDSVNINRLSDGLYLDVNEGFTRLTGYTAQDVAGKSSLELDIWVDPADRARLVAGLTATGSVTNLEARFRRKDGSITTGLMSAQVMEIDGEQCILSITRDISERKAAEAALRASERRFRGLFHNMLEGFALCRMVFDEHGRPADWIYLEVNEAFERLTGLQDVVGRRVTEVIPELRQTNPELFDLYGRVTATGVPADLESHIPSLELDLHLSVFRPEPDCFAVVFENISERLNAEREIRGLNADLERRVRERTLELEAANQELASTNEELTTTNVRLDEATHAKSEFLASMSHELRTPLNSILGFSGTLLQELAGPLQPEQRKQVTMINNSGRHLLALVNDVLDLAKVEAGQVMPVIEAVDCAQIALAACENMRPLAEEKGLELVCACADVHGTTLTDRVKVEQILINLLANAVKFTDSGRIVVDLAHCGDWIEFSVEDTGRGVAPEDAAHVFDEFFQGRTPDGAKTMGTGLGLAVSKRLAVMLGGHIDFESQLGRGARFTVRLPAFTDPEGEATPGGPTG